MDPVVLGGAAIVIGVLYMLTRVPEVVQESEMPAVGNQPIVREVEAPAKAVVGQFVNEQYAVEAPQSTGATTGASAGAGGTGVGGQVAQLIGSAIVTKGNILGATALVGQAAEFANTNIARNTEKLLNETGQTKALHDFKQRQEGGYNMVSGKIDEALLKGSEMYFKGTPPIVQELGKGMAAGVGDVITAPIKVAQILDSDFSNRIGRFNAGDDLSKTLVALEFARDLTPGASGLGNKLLVQGVGGGLADMIAKTPAERAKADEVLDMLNLSKQGENLARIVLPAIQASVDETAARLAREKIERDAAAKALSDKMAADALAANAKIRADLAKIGGGGIVTTMPVMPNPVRTTMPVVWTMPVTSTPVALNPVRTTMPVVPKLPANPAQKAIEASVKETADRLAREKAERDAAAKAASDKLAAEQKARDAALQASLKATADRLAKEAADRKAALAASDAKAKADLAKIAEALKPKPPPPPPPK